jgi:hypothetical protein
MKNIRILIDALVVGGVTWYFTRDLVPTLAVGGTSYLVRMI